MYKYEYCLLATAGDCKRYSSVQFSSVQFLLDMLRTRYVNYAPRWSVFILYETRKSNAECENHHGQCNWDSVLNSVCVAGAANAHIALQDSLIPKQ